MSRDFVLSEGEYISSILRQTPMALAVRLIVPTVLFITPFFFLYPLFRYGTIGIATFAAIILVAVWFLLRAVIIWSNKMLIITNKRIVDQDRIGIVRKIISDIALNKISDVYYEVRGVRQTLSGSGTIHIVLEGNKTQITFSNVTAPQKYQQLIIQLKSDLKDAASIMDAPLGELTEIIKALRKKMGEAEFRKLIRSTRADEDSLQ